MQRVTFLSRGQASERQPPPGAVIVSIFDGWQGPPKLQDGWLDRLNLEFHDTDVPVEGQVLFDDKMANEVLDFVGKHRQDASELFIHCHAGESRSGAMGIVFSELLIIPCFKNTIEVNWKTHSSYNKRVYSRIFGAASDREWGPHYED